MRCPSDTRRFVLSWPERSRRSSDTLRISCSSILISAFVLDISIGRAGKRHSACCTCALFGAATHRPRAGQAIEMNGFHSAALSACCVKGALGEHMDSIVTESVRLDLTKNFGIDPVKVWSIEECKKVLGACIRKKNIKGTDNLPYT